MAVAGDQHGVEPPLEEVAREAVALVESLSVRAVDELNTAGEVGLGGHNDEVVVVRHEAIRVGLPVTSLGYTFEKLQEEQAITVIDIGDLLSVAACGDVVYPAGNGGEGRVARETPYDPVDALSFPSTALAHGRPPFATCLGVRPRRARRWPWWTSSGQSLHSAGLR
jgi:hypothetical protein